MSFRDESARPAAVIVDRTRGDVPLPELRSRWLQRRTSVCPTDSCRSGARCMPCMERDGLTKPA